MQEEILQNLALQWPSLSLHVPGPGSSDTLGEFSLMPQQIVL